MNRGERHIHALRARETAAELVHAFGPERTRDALATAYVPARGHELYPYGRMNRAAVRVELARPAVHP